MRTLIDGSTLQVREHLELFGRIKGIPTQVPWSLCGVSVKTFQNTPSWNGEIHSIFVSHMFLSKSTGCSEEATHHFVSLHCVFQNSVRIPCHNASLNRKELRRLCDQMMQETDPTCWLPGHSEGILDCSTWDHLWFWRKNERQHQDLSLSPHVDKLAMTLSGGNKRDRALDLSLAIPQHKRQRINVQSSRIWTFLQPLTNPNPKCPVLSLSLCVFNVLWWLFPRLVPRKVVACHRLDGLSTARSSGWTQHWSGPSSTSLDVVPWLRILADFDFFQRQRTSCGSPSVSSAKSCSAMASLSAWISIWMGNEPAADKACDLICVHHAEGEYSCSPSRCGEHSRDPLLLCVWACEPCPDVRLYDSERVFSKPLITRAAWTAWNLGEKCKYNNHFARKTPLTSFDWTERHAVTEA